MLRKGFFTAALLLLAVATTLVGLGAKTLLVLRADNGGLQSLALPRVETPTSHSRLLIVAPHPDDEVLGCAGLIQQAVHRGAAVTVVYVTNGDAFPAAVIQQSGRLQPTARDYVRFGYARQREALSVLRGLGVQERNVLFLGYPDRGLSRLWQSHWTPDRPYYSPRTGTAASPYSTSLRPGAPYCGQAVLQDLLDLVRRTRPTDIYVTHPNDDHGDHWAAFCFVASALERLRQQRGALALDDVTLYTYLVHRGDWPVPQGLRPARRLVPPAGMDRLDTWWVSLDLAPGEVAQKKRAVLSYRTQTVLPVERRFMLSFVRSNELFGKYDFGSPGFGDIMAFQESSQPLRIYDPPADKLVRRMNGPADLVLVEAERQEADLQIHLRTRAPLSRWVRYMVTLRGLSTRSGRERGFLLSCIPKRKAPPPATRLETDGRDLTLTVPLRALGGPDAVVVGAETRASGLTIDRSAWKALELQPGLAPQP